MKQENSGKLTLRRGLMAASIAVGFGLSATGALAAGAMNADADEILKSMSKFLAGSKAFSVTADISNEFITVDAQKLQLNSQSTVLVERPGRFYATRKGRFADVEMFFDGSKLTVYGAGLNGYLQQDVSGTIDKAVLALEARSGMSMPGADLLLSDPYAALTGGVTSSGYYGTAWIGGVKAHHLAFRTPTVDWQIWVKDGDQPLPLKYVITSKRLAGAPEYSVVLSNWNLKPAIAADRFKFVPPKGATNLKAIEVDETGEITISGGAK
ncbi:MAG: DUF2092 domain-containing protein [Burkholderiaceae bacterium]|nr:DUF2092 domain-containing protein [Burkholderiaceae bacterium]